MDQQVSVFNIACPEVSCEMLSGTSLFCYRGSVAHGMYVPKGDPNHIDDVDILGFVIAEPEHYLGLQKWGSRGTKEQRVGHYDCVYYELRKAISLLLQGNPNILGTLWLRKEHYIHCDDLGKELIRRRQMFVGKHVYNPLAGYARAQLQKMEVRDPSELRLYLAVTAEMKFRGIHPNHKGERFPVPEYITGESRNVMNWSDERLSAKLRHYIRKGENLGYMGDKRKRLVLEHGYDAKNAAHCIRLLRMAKEFLQEGMMHVYREHDAKELLDIKAGRWALRDIKKYAEELFAEAREARDKSPLPDKPDREAAEAFLVEALRKKLQ